MDGTIADEASMSALVEPPVEDNSESTRVGEIMMVIAAMTIVAVAWAFGTG